MLNLLNWNALFRITLSMHYVHFDDKSFGDNFLSTKFHLPDANWLLETRLTSDSSSSTFPSWSPSIDFSTSFVDFIRFKVDSTQGLVHGYNELRWSMKDDRLSWTGFQCDALLILQSDEPRLMNQWEAEKKASFWKPSWFLFQAIFFQSIECYFHWNCLILKMMTSNWLISDLTNLYGLGKSNLSWSE